MAPALAGALAAVVIALTGNTARPTVTPAQLGPAEIGGSFQLVGIVAAVPRRRHGLLELVVGDGTGRARLRVRYPGPPPEPLRVGERIQVAGTYGDRLFVAEPDTLVVGCGSRRRPEHC